MRSKIGYDGESISKVIHNFNSACSSLQPFTFSTITDVLNIVERYGFRITTA